MARMLEPSTEERSSLFKDTEQYIERFLGSLSGKLTYNSFDGESLSPLYTAIAEEPSDRGEVFEAVEKTLEHAGINAASGGHMGFFPGGGLFHSSLADSIADVLNCYAGVYLASPGAVHMENNLLSWMASLVGYPAGAKGNLTPGGSVSNLIAAVTARDAFKLKSSDYCKSVVYLTAQTHHSLEKALRIAGMKECVKHYIPTDKDFKMDAKVLDREIEKDRRAGLIPWMIVASAGTTDVGAVDPLEEIGKTAAKQKLWYHVDGAYGAFFVLSESGNKILKGMEKSDSIIMDPHKSLFLPFGTGAVLVKNGKLLYDAHSYSAGYMQDALWKKGETSPSDLSPELTKHFRGLRLWLPLKLIGLKPFRAALEEKLLLAKYAYSRLEKIPGMEMGIFPQLSVVTFRYKPADYGVEVYNKMLSEEIIKDGRIFLSSTTLNGRFMLRMAILSFRTHLAEVDLAVKIIAEKIEYLNSTINLIK